MRTAHCVTSPFNFKNLHIRLQVLVLVTAFIGLQAVTANAATINVPSGGDFQAALNSSQPGDTIVLAAGATYVGTFTLPNKSGSSYITIQTSALGSLPAAGVRVSPASAGSMPRIVSPSYQNGLTTAPGAHHYRFIGIEFTVSSPDAQVYDLITIGSDTQTQQSQVPHHITFDRCYVHAHANQSLTGWVRNGFALNGSNIQIIESHLSEFRLRDNEGHAIVGWNGPGPFTINNNFIESSSINVMFGGAWAQPGMNPADLEFKRNHVSKRPEWRGVYSVKNLFELKDMKRAVIDGNVFENCWAHAQPGYAILLTPASYQSGPNARVEDILFTNNIVRHSASAIDMTGRDYGDPSYPNIPVQNNRVTIKNNLFEDIGGSWGEGRFLLLTSGGGPDDLTIDHNTIIHTGTVILLDSGPQARFVFNNNLMSHNAYGIIGVGWMGGGFGSVALNAYAPGYTFRRNLVAGATPSTYPADNFYPSSINAAAFMNSAAGDYRLSPSSPYRNAGTDGKDVGCDFVALQAAQAGTAGPGPTPTPTPTPTPSPTPTPTPTVPNPAALVDDFNDNAFDAGKWVYNTIQGAIYTGPYAWDATVPVLERNQRLEISPRSNVTGDHYNGYVFANAWNMTNMRATVEVLQATASTADTNLAVCVDSRNFFMISVEGGQLRFEQVTAGSRSTSSVTFNAVQHRFWRIRHDQSTDSILFETGTNGQAWTVRRTVARQLPITSLRAEISAGTWEAVGAPGTAIFDNFRLESNNPTQALVSPSMVSSAHQMALSLAALQNPDSSSINGLVASIEQAYTAFILEYSRFSAASDIDKGLRNALTAANTVNLVPRPVVRKRLLITAQYLADSLVIMQATGARPTQVSQIARVGVEAVPVSTFVNSPRTNVRRGHAQRLRRGYKR